MGTSTDGILAWGISFDPDDDEMPDWVSDDTEDDPWEGRTRAFGGVVYGIHCSYDYPMYYVAIKGLATSASRGYPEDVTRIADEALGLGRDSKEHAQLRAFVELNDLPWKEPTLLLMSVWG